MERLLGLRFVREQEEAVSNGPTKLSVTAIVALPLTVRQALGGALNTLDGDRILEVIEMIGHTDPEVATALRERAQRYDYEAIRALLQSAPPGETASEEKTA